MTWGMIGGAAVSVVGGALLSKKSGSSATPQTSTQQQQVDPRIEAMLFGGEGKTGLLDQYQSLLNKPQSAGLDFVGRHSNDFIGAYGEGINNSLMSGANKLMQGNTAPQMGYSSAAGASYNPAAMAQFDPNGYTLTNASAAGINAPKQNSIDTSGAYNQFINGNAAENPYLTGAIQKGLNQSSASFQNLSDDARQALQEGLMGVRGGAIASGQYGGSRQAIAESKVADSISKQLGRALSQVGQNQTDSAVAAQAGAFDAGQNRSLNALSGLSGNQYGIAGQQAGYQQQANMVNAGAANDQASRYSQMGQQLALANANAQNQNNQYYAGLGQNNNQYNTGLQQQTNQANIQSTLNNNSLNANMLQNGMAGLGNLFNTNYNQAQAAGNYDVNRAQQVNGLLSPYMSANQSSTNTTPMYQNNAANFLGGAALTHNLVKDVDWGNLFNSKPVVQDNNYTGTPTVDYSKLPNTFTFGKP